MRFFFVNNLSLDQISTAAKVNVGVLHLRDPNQQKYPFEIFEPLAFFVWRFSKARKVSLSPRKYLWAVCYIWLEIIKRWCQKSISTLNELNVNLDQNFFGDIYLLIKLVANFIIFKIVLNDLCRHWILRYGNINENTFC